MNLIRLRGRARLLLASSVLVVLGAGSVAAQSFNIDCGSYQSYTAADGTVWSADQYYSGGQQFYTGYPVAGTADFSNLEQAESYVEALKRSADPRNRTTATDRSLERREVDRLFATVRALCQSIRSGTDAVPSSSLWVTD